MKDGIILIDKPIGISSRDVVNLVSKKLNTKKIGHTGTLDPLASGLMVLCVNKATKLVEMLTNHDKSYLAKVKLGIKTDSYDITGNIIAENYDYHLKEEDVKKVLSSFVGSYMQEVPIYSSIKVNGRKLYEYARNNEVVSLPKRLVNIKKIELVEFSNDSFSFSVSVSKGTYIRSLINDISKKLNVYMSMEALRRLSVGDFKIVDAKRIEDVSYLDLIDFKKVLNIPIIEVTSILEKKIRNGVKIDNFYNENIVMFVNKQGDNLAIYKDDKKSKLCAYRVF